MVTSLENSVICLFFLSRVRISITCLCANTWPGFLLLGGAGHLSDASLGLMSAAYLCFDQNRAQCRSNAVSCSPPPLQTAPLLPSTGWKFPVSVLSLCWVPAKSVGVSSSLSETSCVHVCEWEVAMELWDWRRVTCSPCTVICLSWTKWAEVEGCYIVTQHVVKGCYTITQMFSYWECFKNLPSTFIILNI